jgi:hypothetical protein
MDTDRLMSEYEMALFDAVLAISQTLLESGLISETALLSSLRPRRMRNRTKEKAAATLTFLIRFIGEPLRYFSPGPEPSN